MGIEKPYEAELGLLGPAPGPPRPLDADALMKQLIKSDQGFVSVCGFRTAVDARHASALGKRLARHLNERHPNADEHTRKRLVGAVGGAVRIKEEDPEALARSLALVIDCL